MGGGVIGLSFFVGVLFLGFPGFPGSFLSSSLSSSSSSGPADHLSIDVDEWDFDAWAALARDDPEAFERRRDSAVNSLIDDAPDRSQRRLRGLQWRVDQERQLAQSPLGACIRISSLMWQNVMDEGGLLDHCEQLSDMLRNPTKS